MTRSQIFDALREASLAATMVQGRLRDNRIGGDFAAALLAEVRQLRDKLTRLERELSARVPFWAQ